MELCLHHAENPNQPALTLSLVWCERQRRTRVAGGLGLGRVLFVPSAPQMTDDDDTSVDDDVGETILEALAWAS